MAEEGIVKSGFYVPNLIAKIYLEAIQDTMGSDGLKALLSMADMQHLVDNLPPDNLAKEFDFADFAHLIEAMEMVYGPRGGRALSLRAGRKAFDQGLRNLGPMVGITGTTFRRLPLRYKMKVDLGLMARAFASTSDQICHVEEQDDHFLYVIERCPVCWGRHSDSPLCHAALGMIQEGMDWGSGGLKFKITEVSCMARGDPACSFSIAKEPLD
jgi:predicted hydrocarbon binding protein